MNKLALNSLLLSIVSCSTIIQSGANTQLKPVRLIASLSTMDKHKLCPKNLDDQKEFLNELLTLLNNQEKAVTFSHHWLRTRKNINELQRAVDRMLLKSPLSFIRPDATVKGFFVAKSAEALAFYFKYKNLFQQWKNEDSKKHIQAISEVTERWQSTKDNDIQFMIKYLQTASKLLQAAGDRKKNIDDPLFTNITSISSIQSNSIKKLIQYPGNPIHFLNILYESLIEWVRIQKIKMANNTFTERDDEHDRSLQALRARICANYDMVKKSIDTFKQEVEAKYKDLTTPMKRKQDDFIADLRFCPKRIPKKNRQNKKNRRRNNNNNKRKVATRPTQKTHTNTIKNDNHKASCSSSAQVKPIAIQLTSSQSPQQTLTLKSNSCNNSNTHPTTLALNSFASKLTQDGSKTTHEDETMVRIADKLNNAVIKLFKVADPQQEYRKPNYTSWVNAWLEKPEQAKREQGYNDPQSHKLKYRESAHIVHGFTPLVDKYLSLCSTKSTIESRKNSQQNDILLTIPGSITQNKKEEFGLFTYIINSKTKQWYHRNFVPRTNKQLLVAYMKKGFYNVEFPELSKISNSSN